MSCRRGIDFRGVQSKNEAEKDSGNNKFFEATDIGSEAQTQTKLRDTKIVYNLV